MKYLSNVTTIKLDREKCKGCGACVEVCPHGLLEMSDGKAIISDKDACMECGACKMNCPYNAIEVTSGVGCAAAIIGSTFGKKGSGPCCG
jgi:NAD-dependent dihydropyrimidine dehydrogenase PreA subunit